jgi:outer membrane protein assembly factor BamB
MQRMIQFVPIAAAAFLLMASAAVAASPSDNPQAMQILEATGVRGGLIVHLGCGDGRLTAALRQDERFLVQGLDADPQHVEAARKYVQSLGLYGKVSIDRLTGSRLPYIEDFVNLIVAEKSSNVPAAELLRVLAPGGVAYVKQAGAWTKTVKPRPQEMDEWTHYLHDATGNAVAHDSLVDSPRRMQWIAGPRYSRHHDHMSAVSAMVSAAGRTFDICDEAPRESILIPPQWYLTARDAFNGSLLWKRPLESWHNHLWPLKSGPQLMTRRLVAVGDRVYVTLGIDTPLTALDAATGKTIRTYEGTKATEEILCDHGVLFLSVAAGDQPLRSDPKPIFTTVSEASAGVTNPLWTDAMRTIMAVDAESGRVLWQKVSKIVAESLTADAQRVLLHDGERIQCLDRNSGAVRWSSEPLARRDNMRSSSGVTMVAFGDVILYSGMAPARAGGGRATMMYAVSAEDGKTLWKAAHPPCGHMGTPDDILVAGGLVWCGAVAEGTDSGEMTGRDLHTGEVKSHFTPDVETHWFHHRCYRAKATDKYLLFSRTGIEFIDFAAQHWTPNHWVRGACLYGIMPCNGMVYAPPHPCACYLEAKLYGFTALAPQSKTWQPIREPSDEGRLEKGPAYADAERAANPHALIPNPSDWPTYRHDAARSGGTKLGLPAAGLKRAWQTDVGGRLSSPVIADGRLVVASIDTHTIHALDAENGKALWTFTAGGRVDSAPTLWQGRVLFGSADGYVYCLRAVDGRLTWRFRAAPEDRRMMSFEQVESVWPVPGSVLLQNDTLYCVAGRSMFLDGGMRMLRLDPTTGQKLSETILDDRDPESNKNLQVQVDRLNMPVALPDILSSDGRNVYLRSLPFDMQGKRRFVGYVDVKDQKGDDIHLFSPTGFLDDTMWHRTYWVYGRAFASGAGGYFQAGRIVPAGRLMVFDDATAYAFGRLPQLYCWTTPIEFQLYATSKQPDTVKISAEEKKRKQGKKGGGLKAPPGTGIRTAWAERLAAEVNSMLLADKALFVAGPPDMVDEDQAVKSISDPKTIKALAEQEAALEGRRGALLVVVSPESGKRLAGYRLDSMPVFDGLAAAGGCLYFAAKDGKVICLDARRGQTLPSED